MYTLGLLLLCRVCCVCVQVIGSDAADDNSVSLFTEVQRYCQATRGQHIHDVLDHINLALRVSKLLCVS